MAKTLRILVVVFLSGFSSAQATFLPSSNTELAQSCYHGSPELLSDKCFGREYSMQYPPNYRMDGYPANSDSQLSGIYKILNALQGSGSSSVVPSSDQQYAMGALLDWRGTSPDLGLMQNSNPSELRNLMNYAGALK